jgi:[ribosomal protein S5]-alanine N-acetyltransferase
MTALVRGRLVFLRHPTLADEAEFYQLRRVSLDLHRRWEPAPLPGADPFGHAEFVQFVDQANSDRYQKHLVCRVDDDRICGYIGLNEIVSGHFRSAYSGYWVGAPFARRGYTTEAMSLCLERAFTTLNLHRVEANIIPTNLPSLAVARKSGMRREGYSPRYLRIAGVWQDHERWAITKEDWEALEIS